MLVRLLPIVVNIMAQLYWFSELKIELSPNCFYFRRFKFWRNFALFNRVVSFEAACDHSYMVQLYWWSVVQNITAFLRKKLFWCWLNSCSSSWFLWSIINLYNSSENGKNFKRHVPSHSSSFSYAVSKWIWSPKWFFLVAVILVVVWFKSLSVFDISALIFYTFINRFCCFKCNSKGLTFS